MRAYRVVRRDNEAGECRWSVEGDCLTCPEQDNCGHWVLMPWRWPTAEAAGAWVEAVQRRQDVLDRIGVRGRWPRKTKQSSG